MQCRQCQKHVADGASLIRMNEKGPGIKPIWECSPGTGCNKIDGAPEPSQDEKLIDAITGGTKWN